MGFRDLEGVVITGFWVEGLILDGFGVQGLGLTGSPYMNNQGLELKTFEGFSVSPETQPPKS